ncbi:MAG: undecaprenyl-diphosphate phosphatase [Verrucomicrobia bacterium]|nr:undecaprenyl-diphosphate phosphatase [Verrucomicrobiota bacterium]
MLSYFQILFLAIIQGACELLPVSSSAHVIVAEKLMGLDPSAPAMTLLLVMLHTGTMFAVIVYFWNGWRRDYFSSWQTSWSFIKQVFLATICTGVVGLGLKIIIEKVFLRGTPHAEVEMLFSNLPLIATALAIVGFFMIYAGNREGRVTSSSSLSSKQALGIGLVQGLCLPFRGFSRSGSTISAGLLFGLPKKKIEEFSFALAVVLTPIVIAKEMHRLVHAHVLSSDGPLHHLFFQTLVGMVFSFFAGLLALRWLSRWLEGGRWKYFGIYCLIASSLIFFLNYFLL